ncbi:CtsR family transcriptional regulator, partial [Escherichia coli]|nr:CtsR family transcriptional regulator [Escherichia coli]
MEKAQNRSYNIVKEGQKGVIYMHNMSDI